MANNNNLLWRPLQTSLASCTSLTAQQMRESADFHWFSSDYGIQDRVPFTASLYDPDAAGSLSLYDDMLVSKDFEDEELAEIDMESFCREDMHNLLLNKGRRGSSCALVTSSIYRPERLFSPLPDQIHLSQDSLDMSGYPTDGDIIQTCKANKSNYTIAFEGSIICSEASFYAGAAEALDQRKRDLLEDLERRKAALKMSTSVDYNLTTWSKLKKTHNSSHLSRFLTAPQPPPPPRKMQCWEEKRSSMGSSNNLSIMHPHAQQIDGNHPHWLSLRRTKSLSSLTAEPPFTTDSHHPIHHPVRPKLNVSQVIMDNMDQESSASASYEQNKLRSLLPNCAIPMHHSQNQSLLVDQQQQHQQHHPLLHQQKSEESSSTTTTSNNNAVQPGGGGDRQPSFNLVKLFIKQKSSSTDTCMDVSSGCWPSDSPSMSFEQQQQHLPAAATTINANIQNRNYFKRSLKLDRHEEENDVDSLDPLVNNNGGGGGAKTDPHGLQLEKNNNLINNLINNNHCLTDETTSEEHSITQIYNNIRNNNGGVPNAQHQQLPKNTNLRRMQLQETITRSMQTSIPKLITSATQYASKAADAVVLAAAARNGNGGGGESGLSQRVRIVPTSFLKKLHMNERRGEGGMAPVYVIYPNYTLPNLDFVTKHEVILSPIDYKEPFLGMNGAGVGLRMGAISKVKPREVTSPGRPKSFSDILGGKQRTKFDYKNICDWRSLIILLPVEYSRILRSIPDIEKELEGHPEDTDGGFGDAEEEEDEEENPTDDVMTNSRQLFCQTTPVMRRRVTRPLSCDCTNYIMQTSSSSSSSNQPASSGYRGSSTILTDSEFGVMGIDTTTTATTAEPSDDTTGLPPTHCGRTPKGILRRNFNRTRLKMQQGKRNSMFDGSGEKLVDKRRSLQEFPTQQYFDNMQLAEATANLSPLLNYKQQGSGNDLNRFRTKLSSELEALEMELYEAAARSSGDEMTVVSPAAATTNYDRLKLRNDVSRALCNHPKRVSFSESNSEGDSTATVVVSGGEGVKRGVGGGSLSVPGVDFTTPPNSPNVSVVAQQKRQKRAQQSEQERIQSNRFKRLQIQWELMSKDSESLLEELNEIIPAKMETKSGGSTPTGPQRISRIPRPISYPSSRIPTKTAAAAVTSRKVSSPTAANSPRLQNNNNRLLLGQRRATNVTTNRFVPKAR